MRQMSIEEMRETITDSMRFLRNQSETIAVQRQYIQRLEAQNDELRRQLGKRKLLDDLKLDLADLGNVSIFHKPQAE